MLTKVKLLWDWGTHQAGDVLEVDPQRAQTLIDDEWAVPADEAEEKTES